MSEATAEETETAPTPEVPHKRRLRPKLAWAVMEVIQAAHFVKRPPIKGIALKRGVNYLTLKQAYHDWTKDKVDLGEASKIMPSHKEIDTRIEMGRALANCDRIEQFLNDMIETTMGVVSAKSAEGRPVAFFELGVPDMIDAMHKVARLRKIKEEGFMAILESAQRAAAEEKRQADLTVKPANAVDIQATVSEVERFRKAMGEPISNLQNGESS